ncbi:MAG: sensor histidine kinase, partial [Myxococcota bacterium]
SLNYQPIHDETGKVEKLLVVISDITEELARAETEAQQRENLRLFELIASDANGFEEFYNEADKMLRRVVDDAELPLRDLKRLVHTLKGNTAIFGLERISRCCHDLEEGIETSGERPERPELEGLDEAWSHIVEKVRQLTGGDRKRQMVVEREDIDALLQGIRDETPYARLERQVQRMHMEPTSKRVAVLAEQAQKIAERLGKTNLRIEQQVRGDVRFEPARWASFWSSLVHVFRNAVDHGLEKSDERADRGKKEEGLIALRTYAESDRFVFEVEDDGRGIDLEALRAKVEARGHEVGSDDDLVQKIFEDGVTTKNVVTETSGRGVGMAAVRAEVEALGGEVAVATRPGEGTRFSFSFPIEEVSPPEATARG